MVARPRTPRRPLAQRSRPDRVGARGGAARATAPEAFDTLGVEDGPHRLRGDRRALGHEVLRDLGHRAVLGAQLEHPVADRVCLARSSRPGLGGSEELAAPGAQLGGQLVQRRDRVAETFGYLGRRHLVDEVGTQRLVAALGGDRRLDEVLGARPHDCR